MERQPSGQTLLKGDARHRDAGEQPAAPPIQRRGGWRQLAGRPKTLEAIGCVAIALLALALFLAFTNNVSLWYDETYSLAVTSLPLPLFWKVHQANMLLYYLLLYSWLKITALLGLLPTPLVARLPSIIAMALAAVVTFLIGTRFWNLAVGIAAGLLFVLNALMLQQAQQARGYALQVLLISLATYALLLALRQPDAKRWWVVYVAMSTLAVYAQIVTVFVIAAQALAVVLLLLPPIARRAEDFPALAARGWRAYILPGIIALLATVVACVPLAFDAVHHRGDTNWIPVATPASLWVFITTLTRLNAIPALALLLAIILGVVLGLRTGRGLAVLLVVWGFTPIGLQFVLSLPYPNLHFFYPRYLIGAVSPLLLLAAIGMTEFRPNLMWLASRWPAFRPQWGAVALTLLVLALMVSTPIKYYGNAEVQPFLGATHWMESRYQTGDGIICRPAAKACGVPIGFYLTYLYTGPETMPTVFPGSYNWATGRSTSTQTDALISYLRDHPRVFVFSTGVITGVPRPITDDVPTTLTGAGYRLVGSFQTITDGGLGDVEVAEYDR